MKYADVIVDISLEKLDRSYQYLIPANLQETVVIGALVLVSFGSGNRHLNGYVVGLSDETDYDRSKIKPVLEVIENSLIIESHLIELAYWIKDQYGATINDALKTVIQVKKTVRIKEKKTLILLSEAEEARALLESFLKKKHTAKARLMQELMEEKRLDFATATEALHIGSSVIQGLEKQGIIKIEIQQIYRNPVKEQESELVKAVLNREQQQAALDFEAEYQTGIRRTYLVHGVTGSGKTELYMAMIDEVLKEGKQVIFMIPEIALTYQMVKRFLKRFGGRITILNSRMSAGERYDQYSRAKQGEIDIVIGPRSALFTPFSRLGLIILDEEHESSYKSEMPPKYHARETAIQRAQMLGASVVLGSATPSMEAYSKALSGEYKLYTLTERAGGGSLPHIIVEDLREELKARNKSILSRKLKELIEDRLQRKEQIMLFINRRGYAGFVSCRSCGFVVKCSHCDISMTYHSNGTLVCHYCGSQTVKPSTCPNCSSPYIAAFGTGTQKVEELVKKEFPMARILRMDTDTTAGKEGHEKILSVFANGEADIMVGTQMIVKGHDFGRVTLVGILAADLSLFANDYRGAERTFELLSQAAGRAGRSSLPGDVVIQTYNPDHYSIRAAAENNYIRFYQEEMGYRNVMGYPPAAHILAVLVTSKKEEEAEDKMAVLRSILGRGSQTYKVIGPAKASMSKLNDIYRWIMYLKAAEYETLKECRTKLEKYMQNNIVFKYCVVQFDFDPMNSY